MGCIALAKSIKESEVSILTCLDLKVGPTHLVVDDIGFIITSKIINNCNKIIVMYYSSLEGNI